MGGVTDLEGVHGPIIALDLECGVGQAAGSPRFQRHFGVLGQDERWPTVFMLFFHCLWVWKGRTDVSAPFLGFR